MLYKQKYLKYKNKYIDLKKQLGGSEATAFKPKTVLNPGAAEYKPTASFNPGAAAFKPKTASFNPGAAAFEPTASFNPRAAEFKPINPYSMMDEQLSLSDFFTNFFLKLYNPSNSYNDVLIIDLENISRVHGDDYITYILDVISNTYYNNIIIVHKQENKMTRLDNIIKGIIMNPSEPLYHRLTSINIINIRLYDTKTDTTMTMQTVSPMPRTTLTPEEQKIINGYDDYFILYLYYSLHTRTSFNSIAILTHDTRMISDLESYLYTRIDIPPIYITMKQNDKVLFTSQLVYYKEEIEKCIEPSNIDIYNFLM